METTTLLLRHALFLCAFLFGIFGVSWGQATIYDWESGAPDGNWRQGTGGARWWPGGLWDEPPAGNELRFNNNTFTTMNNNVSGYTLNKLTFGSSATSSRNISGNNITFYDNGGVWPRIDNLSGTSQTIGFPITVGTNSNVWNLELKSSSGPLILNSSSTISNNTSKILYIYGNSTTNSDRYVELDGVISGNGSLQVKLGGIAKIGANHSYTGSTNIEHGELWIDNGGDLSSTSSINLGLSTSMSSVAKIFISDMDGGTTFTRNIIVSDGNTSTRNIGSFNTIGTNYFSGTISRSATNNLTLEAVSSSGTVEFSNDISGSGQIIKIGLGTAVLSAANSYTGETTINAGTLQLNKTGGSTLPSTNSIAVNSDGMLRISSNQTLVNLTIASGGSVIVDANVQLTITGTLTNNGTLTLENGATFKQGSSVAGTGTYNVKQTIDNGAGSGSTLTGRYWYLGSPLVCTRSSAFGASGNLNKVWQFSNGAYSNVADATSLSPTTGYVHRRSDASSTLTFSAQNLYAQDVTLSLSNNAGTYGGWHLIANPYTAYLDWSQVYTASHALSAAISPSYYIRSFNSTGNDVNALITYNSSTGLESNTSSYSLGSTGSTIAQHIAPMQAIWVKVNPTTPLSATAGQLRLERAFTSHQTGNVGLKNTGVYPVLARVNLYNGAKFDQALVYMNEYMTNAVDQNDSEKMFVSGATQIYTMAAGKKLVMNGLKNNKKKISVPLYLELPTSKVYQLQLSEHIMEDGLIILEDKQEGTMQDFTIHDTYAFYANSGVLQNRFVLHFYMPDATITAQGPSNSWVESEAPSYTEGGQIVIAADGKGKVQITLDQSQADNVNGSVQAMDANGRVVYTGILEGITTAIQLDVPSGIYYLTVQSGNLIEQKKVFIQE